VSWWSDVVLAIESAAGGESAALQTAAANPQNYSAPNLSIPGLSGLVTVIEGIWAGLTDGKMWRSLGWIILGIVLMLLGVGWWIGPSAARRSPVGLAAEGLG
jgi:hypothetical protein